MSLEHSPAGQKKAGRTSDIAPVLISDLETAKLLGCSRATIWRRVADATLEPPVKIGGMTRFVLSEILAVVDRAKKARAVSSTSEPVEVA